MSLDRTLSYDRTVSRSHVHVRALAEIFIADSAQVGPDEFLLSAQLPRGHATWADRLVPYHDPLVAVEVGRQAAFLVAHAHCGVPVDSPCLLHRVRLTVTDLEAFRDDGLAPPQGVISARVFDKRERDGELTGMGFAGELWFGDSQVVTMDGDMAIFRRSDYTVLRAQTRARRAVAAAPPERARIDPALVGRIDERNVVISDGEDGRYPLVVDRAHPGFFDHQHDHITGSLMLEAFRQSAVVTAHRRGLLAEPLAAVTDCALQFTGLGELDAPAECVVAELNPADGGVLTARLEMWQLGVRIAEARYSLAPLPRSRPDRTESEPCAKS